MWLSVLLSYEYLNSSMTASTGLTTQLIFGAVMKVMLFQGGNCKINKSIKLQCARGCWLRMLRQRRRLCRWSCRGFRSWCLASTGTSKLRRSLQTWWRRMAAHWGPPSAAQVASVPGFRVYSSLGLMAGHWGPLFAVQVASAPGFRAYGCTSSYPLFLSSAKQRAAPDGPNKSVGVVGVVNNSNT